MDKTKELLRIFEQSGLRKLLVVRQLRYFDAYTPYSKLLLAKNAFRVQALAIYAPQTKQCYLRVTYHHDAPLWLSQSMSRWDILRSQNAAGASFEGDPLTAARALADLLIENL